MKPKCPIHFNDFDDICMIMEHEQFRVRPLNQRVPPAIKDTLAGLVFSDLVRMRDDDLHTGIKQALINTINYYDNKFIYQQTLQVAKIISPKIASLKQLNYFIQTIPICLIASLFEVPAHKWAVLVEKVRDFIDFVILAPSHEAKERAESATQYLFHMIKNCHGHLLQNLRSEFKQHHIDEDRLSISNGIGLFFQTADGTSGLLGQMLVSYADNNISPEKIVADILAQTPPIKQTKRFSEQNLMWREKIINQDDLIILNLKSTTDSLPFGLGKHVCPGSEWAKTIAITAFNYLKDMQLDYDWFKSYCWKTSANATIPEFYIKKDE